MLFIAFAIFAIMFVAFAIFAIMFIAFAIFAIMLFSVLLLRNHRRDLFMHVRIFAIVSARISTVSGVMRHFLPFCDISH